MIKDFQQNLSRQMRQPLKPFYREGTLEAGCDEAGRGCLAGPVFAAAVILPPRFYHPLLNDSKALTARQRDELRQAIESGASCWAVASASNQEIDTHNILNASILAMHRAITKLNLLPSLLLVDGNRFSSYNDLPHVCIIRGDATYASIAAASILAKTHRDDFMKKAHEEYPYYHWNENKGYPTRKHREGIALHGSSPLHRITFRL